MQLNLKEKAQLINQVGAKYFTRRNKPLSLVILLVIFVLFAISQPVIAFFMLVAYGLILVSVIKRGQVIGNKEINNKTRREKNENE